MARDYAFFFFSSRRRHTRLQGDWSSDVCSSDLLVMTMGTLYLAHICMSCSSRSLLLCTIWLMANGAEGRSGWALSQAARVSVISASQSSSCSAGRDRKSTRLNSSHLVISYAVFCLKKKKQIHYTTV